MPGPANATSPLNMTFAFPDTCLEPPPVGALPFPNTSQGITGVPFAPNVLFSCMPAHNMTTTHPVSLGDQASTGGVASGITSGPSHPVTACFNILVMGTPVTSTADVTINNNSNAPGATVAPSQVTVICL